MINKCLFPAAGYGTRFLPATKAIPKEMLPILTKPLLQYGVEEALSAGITNMAIVTGRGKRSIEDHFDNSYEIEAQLKNTPKEHLLDGIKEIIKKATFTYVRQQEMLGLGHAILSGEALIGDEAFAVVLADDLCDYANESIIKQMIKIYEKYNCSIVAIEEIPIEESYKYGIISGNLITGSDNIIDITEMEEKPLKTKSNLAIIGRYILTPDIFNILRKIQPGKNGEIQITDALMEQVNNNKRVLAYKFQGRRFDCGSIEGYLEATNHFAKTLNLNKS